MANVTVIRSTEEIEKELRAQIKNHNDALANGDTVHVVRLKKAIDINVKEYNAASEQEVMIEIFRENKTPQGRMIAAINRLTFPTVKVSEIDKENNPNLQWSDDKKKIDFVKYDKYRPGEFGASSDWLQKAKKLGMLMTVRVAKELGIDPKTILDCIRVDRMVRDIELAENDPEAKVPISNGATMAEIKSVLSAMVGEEWGKLAISYDRKYLDCVFTREGKNAREVRVANTSRLIQYLAQMCQRVMYDKPYEVTGFDKVKQNNSTPAPAAAPSESKESAPAKKPRKSRKSAKSTESTEEIKPSEESSEIETTTDAE